VHVVCAQALEQRPMALLAFRERHGQRPLQGIGGAADVVGIDEQRLVELLGRAGEARQHQHARVGRVLRCDEFLGHQVHPVAQWRDHADARGAEQARQAPP